MKLNHLSTKAIAESNLFFNIKSYSDMMKNIIKYGKTKGVSGEEAYNDATGTAFEVYTEFFFKRYGTISNPLLGVLFVEDTSQNQYEEGIDFHYQDFDGVPSVIQSKFRSNPSDKFTRKYLGTFISVCDEEDIPKKNRILFTSIEHHTDNTVFHFSWPKGHTQMRTIGRNQQEEFIERDSTFWVDLQETINKSLQAPIDFKKAPKMWEHQIRMNNSVKPILKKGGSGRVICATGGGKTRVIYQNAMDGFKKGFCVQVIVAPTIDLLRQHHAYFEKYGAFHKDGVSVIHFRTGEECKDNWTDSYQTTSPKDAIDHFTTKTLIFVTYQSEEKFFNGLDENVDAVYWDEFHHTVQQNIEHKDHLLSIPSDRNLFYSASIKRGRIISGMDETIYGPLLCEIKYSELRRMGILVPKIIIKTIFIDRDKIRHIEKIMKKAAKRDNFDLATGVVETAGLITAMRDMKSSGKNCNAVSFSKSVPICKEITSNESIRKEFNCDELNTVHSGVHGRERKKIYEKVRSSTDSMLCQYSVVKEGIDINPFNCVIFSRNMDVIGTQQAIGRAVRANPEDKKKFDAGLISIDSPEGWIKYDATLYIIMHEIDSNSFKQFLSELVQKLQFTGLEEDDFEFVDISEGRHGMIDDEGDWFIPIDELKSLINVESVHDALKNSIIEADKQEFDNVAMVAVSKLSLLELI